MMATKKCTDVCIRIFFQGGLANFLYDCIRKILEQVTKISIKWISKNSLNLIRR